MTGLMLKYLEEFHQRAARRIVVMTDFRAGNGKCKYHPVADTPEGAEICTIKEFIQRFQATIAVQLYNRKY